MLYSGLFDYVILLFIGEREVSSFFGSVCFCVFLFRTRLPHLVLHFVSPSSFAIRILF